MYYMNMDPVVIYLTGALSNLINAKVSAFEWFSGN